MQGGNARPQRKRPEGVRTGEKCVLASFPGQGRVFHGKRQHAVSTGVKRMMRKFPGGRSPFPFRNRLAGPGRAALPERQLQARAPVMRNLPGIKPDSELPVKGRRTFNFFANR